MGRSILVTPTEQALEKSYNIFLKVGREFYYFWKGDSSAPDHVKLNQVQQTLGYAM